MTNATKLALEEALKRLLLKKPLDKITINDLTTDCGISRMTFYYHFKDIYDLVEWSCLEDARIALQGKKTSSTWQEGLLQIFEAVTENKPFILNVYRCVGREQIENYLFHLTFDLLMGVVEEKSRGISISKEQKVFIADLYKYSFVGIMLDWIKNGMKEDYHVIVNDIATALYGSIDNAIQNFSKKPSSLTEKDLPGQNKNLSDPA
jgi:probable dihydroxyacetone kinase regulator